LFPANNDDGTCTGMIDVTLFNATVPPQPEMELYCAPTTHYLETNRGELAGANIS
jgi:hypothetical protein